jgi:hypothetical protein
MYLNTRNWHVTRTGKNELHALCFDVGHVVGPPDQATATPICSVDNSKNTANILKSNIQQDSTLTRESILYHLRMQIILVFENFVKQAVTTRGYDTVYVVRCAYALRPVNRATTHLSCRSDGISSCIIQ